MRAGTGRRCSISTATSSSADSNSTRPTPRRPPVPHRRCANLKKCSMKRKSNLVKQTLDNYLAPGMPGETWRIQATAIERTHLHLLFGPLKDPIGEVVGRIKSRTSSALLKLPVNHDRRRIWTTGYRKVFLFDDDAMAQVAEYVNAHRGRRASRSALVSGVEDLPDA